VPNCCDRISSKWEPSMGEVTTIGLDLAKHVFQVHGVDAEGATVLRKQLRRAQVLAFFSRLPPCLVGLEACATAHYWGREVRALGHEVRLMPAQYVKAYIKRNKHDAADAEAICEAVGRPTMRYRIWRAKCYRCWPHRLSSWRRRLRRSRSNSWPGTRATPSASAWRAFRASALSSPQPSPPRW